MVDGDQGNPTGNAPPRRLVDQAAPGSPWAVDLLRSASPYEAPAGRRERVRAELTRTSTRRMPLLFRLAVVGVVLIGFGALARASLGHWPSWVIEAYRSVMAPASTQARLEPRPRPRPAPLAELAVAAPNPALEPVTARAPIAAPAAAPRETTRRARIAGAPAAGEDTTIVLEAMRALRLQHNPVRSRALLARYLERYPNGTLAEEALAMSIEAAVAHHDADAVALASRYLSRYPHGPFHGLARQTLYRDPQRVPRPPR